VFPSGGTLNLAVGDLLARASPNVDVCPIHGQDPRLTVEIASLEDRAGEVVEVVLQLVGNERIEGPPQGRGVVDSSRLRVSERVSQRVIAVQLVLKRGEGLPVALPDETGGDPLDSGLFDRCIGGIDEHLETIPPQEKLLDRRGWVVEVNPFVRLAFGQLPFSQTRAPMAVHDRSAEVHPLDLAGIREFHERLIPVPPEETGDLAGRHPGWPAERECLQRGLVVSSRWKTASPTATAGRQKPG